MTCLKKKDNEWNARNGPDSIREMTLAAMRIEEEEVETATVIEEEEDLVIEEEVVTATMTEEEVDQVTEKKKREEETEAEEVEAEADPVTEEMHHSQCHHQSSTGMEDPMLLEST